MTIALLSAPERFGLFIAALVFHILVAGGIGRLIGQRNGRGTFGFWCGVLLGWFGWLIAALAGPRASDPLNGGTGGK